MSNDDIRSRLEALLTDYVPDGPDLTPAGELKAILAMPPSIREAITERLEAIDRFQKDPGTARADAEAKRLGMKRRNFYNLVARLRMDGPSRALSPSKAGYRRGTTLGSDLDNLIESSIAETLSDDPEATASAVIVAVQRKCHSQGIKAPSDRTIRLRLASLKSEPSADLKLGDGVLGREIFIDQSAASFVLEDGPGGTLGLVTLIVDAGTRLILGIGAGSSASPESGLERAVEDWGMRRSHLPYGLFECRVWPDSVHWVVPDKLAEEGKRWQRTAALSELATFVTTEGARRHGSRLLRTIGATLGWLRFLPRNTGDGSIPDKLSAKLARLDARSAQEAASVLADNWNDNLSLNKAGEDLSADPQGVAQERSNVGVPFGLDWVVESLQLSVRHAEAWEALRAQRYR